MIDIEDIYKSTAFRLLAQGMKDKQAINIVAVLMLAGLFETFERWCEERERDVK